MTLSGKFRVLTCTAPTHPPTADGPTVVPAVLTEARFHVTLVLSSQRKSLDARRQAAAELASDAPADRRYYDVEALQRRFGPSDEEMQVTEDLIREFATQENLQVVSISRRCAVLGGAISDVADAFRVGLEWREVDGHTLQSHREDVSLPVELIDRVDHVLGLNNLAKIVRERPIVRAQKPSDAKDSDAEESDESHAGQDSPHTEPDDLSNAYDFPPSQGLSGPVKRIGVISLGGGLFESDLREYFERHGVEAPRIKIVRQPPADPEIQLEAVDGRWADPAPFELFEVAVDHPEKLADVSRSVLAQLKWTVEVTMDVQLIGRLCPGVEIVVFVAENNNQGQYWAFSEALYGPLSPPVLSCSWGTLEPGATKPDRVREVEILDSLLLDATLLGITICVSSGDKGDGSTRSAPPRAEFPASSPHVLACGGTMFTEGVPQGPEVVWSETVQGSPMASGGGFSTVFPRPDWQEARLAQQPRDDPGGRGIPDVASKADVKRGFCMMIGGVDIANGGTSAAAPVWASLLAMAANDVGAPLGNINALLYSQPFTPAARSVEHGSNGYYQASIGWDPCTGLGSPKWTELCSALKAAETAE